MPVVTTALFLMAAVVCAQPAEEGRRYRLAQGYESGGDDENASRVYLELYRQDPQSNVYFDAVRRTYTRLGAFDALLPVVEERVRRFPRDVSLRAQYGDVLQRTGRADDAAIEWRGALEQRPDDPGTYQAVAQAQVDNRLVDAAVETYRIGRRRLNIPTAFNEQLASLLGAAGRIEEAVAEYLAILDADAERLGFVMGGMGMFTTNPEAAATAITAVRARLERTPGSVPHLELLGWLCAERGDEEGGFEAAKRLDEIRSARGAELLLYADRALRESRFDAAIRALEYVRATYGRETPVYASVVLEYARALEARYAARAEAARGETAHGETAHGEAADLVERYTAIARENPDDAVAPAALLRAARLQVEALDDPDAALATLADVRSRYPRFRGRGEAVLLEGDCALRVGDLERAAALYSEGASLHDGDDDASRHRDLAALRGAELLLFTGAFKEAAPAFASLADNTSSDVANDALAYQFLLQEHAGKYPDALRHYAAGMLSLRRRRWDEAAASLDSAVQAARMAPLAAEALVGKAEAEEKSGEVREAVATLLHVVDAYPDGTVADRALFHAGELLERSLDDRVKAAELYAKLLEAYPASSYAAPARARLRALRGS